MKKIVCFIFIFFIISSNICKAENVKFLQVTDVHLSQNNAKYLKQFVEDINKNYKDLDFIVFTGDNINNANIDDLELFLNIVKNLKRKTYIIPGNHDLFKSHELDSKSYMKRVKKRLGYYHSNKPNYIIKKRNVIFITMNGVKEIFPGPNGYYRQEELDWLDKMLNKYKNKKVVILQHFPLIDTEAKNHSLYRKEDYEQVLKKHNNVISIVSGHYHENIELKKDGIYHIITQKFSNNNYYKIIEVSDKNMVFTYLIDKSENEY